MQVLPDDVAAELPGGPGLHCAAEQLHAVLHLPHAHPLHHHGVRRPRPGPQIQQKQCWHHVQVSSFSALLTPLLVCHAGSTCWYALHVLCWHFDHEKFHTLSVGCLYECFECMPQLSYWQGQDEYTQLKAAVLKLMLCAEVMYDSVVNKPPFRVCWVPPASCDGQACCMSSLAPQSPALLLHAAVGKRCCCTLHGHHRSACHRRMLICVGVVFLCWDVKPVFYAIWTPFQWVMGYSDPRKPTTDLLHGMHLCLR